MKKTKRTIFISDIHLNSHYPDITDQFLNLISNIDPSIVDGLYILGDLFEVWIGDDDSDSLHLKIMHALNEINKKGVPVYVMHGNRDFLMGIKFSQLTGCQLLEEETKISLYGVPVLLMHGDTLCTRDFRYLKARKFMRNRWLQQLFLHLPLKFRKKIADYLRAQSKRHTQSLPLDIMDVTNDAITAVMRQHKVKFLVHGHTHQCAMHHFILDGMDATRIVLDAWHEKGSALVWDENGKKEYLAVDKIRF